MQQQSQAVEKSATASTGTLAALTSSLRSGSSRWASVLQEHWKVQQESQTLDTSNNLSRQVGGTNQQVP
jgi:hypothetical protein